MNDYDLFSHQFPPKDVITAWAVAVAVLAFLLVLPEFARKKNGDGLKIGTRTAIEQTIPGDTDFDADDRR